MTPPKDAATDPRRRWLASRVSLGASLVVIVVRLSFACLFSLTSSSFPSSSNTFQLSDAFSLPLAEATAAVERFSSAVDAFFDGKSSDSENNSESLAWFYQPRETTPTATATAPPQAELFLSDLSVKNPFQSL